MQRKVSLAPEEQEQKTQEAGRIYQALKIRACSSEECVWAVVRWGWAACPGPS